MARDRMIEIFGANVEECLTRCEPKDLENNLLFDKLTVMNNEPLSTNNNESNEDNYTVKSYPKTKICVRDVFR